MKTIHWKYLLLVAVLIIVVTIFLGHYFQVAWLWQWLFAINLVAFLMFLLDKIAATHHTGRVPNLILQLLIILAGFVGGWAGVILLRHKSQKLSYYFILILATIFYSWLIINFDLFQSFDINID